MRGNKLRTLTLAVIAGLVGLTACQDLDVENPNAPDRSRALATAGDVESLIGGAYLNYFNVSQGWQPGPALSVASDEHTSSWGNFGMKQFGNEPRLAIDNNPSWGYAYVLEDTWYFSYGAISAASDGLGAIEGGLQIGEGGEDTPRARAFARFMQGIGHAVLAATYDQAFVYDETVDLTSENPVELQPYGAVMDAALGYLDQAATIAENNSFTTPSGWIQGRELSSGQFSRLVHSYMARFMASTPRGPGESVDWAGVVSHIEQGIQEDFYIQGTGWTGDWWAPFKSYGGWFPIWGRTDLRLLGKADTTGAYQSWEQTPAEQRQPFLIETADRRITGHEANPNVEGEPSTGPTSQGKYFTYYSYIPFVPGRGTYHFSNYGNIQYGHPSNPNQIVEVTTEEMDLLKAEAMIAMGNPDSAAALVNKTRVANGELPPVDANGVPSSAECVPRDINGNCGSLMEAVQYEKRLETWHVSAGVQFYDLRRWGKLVDGTPLHFPIPGAELQVLQEDIYTYGGGGSGSAGADASIFVDGDVELSERIDAALQALRAQQERLSKDRPSMKR